MLLVSLAYLRINYEVREGLKCTWVSLFKGFNKSPYGVVRIIVGVCCNKYCLVVVEIIFSPPQTINFNDYTIFYEVFCCKQAVNFRYVK